MQYLPPTFKFMAQPLDPAIGVGDGSPPPHVQGRLHKFEGGSQCIGRGEAIQ